MCINTNYECDFTAKQVKSCVYGIPEYPEDGQDCSMFDEYGTQFEGNMEPFPAGWYCCPKLYKCSPEQEDTCGTHKYCCWNYSNTVCTNNDNEQVIEHCSHLWPQTHPPVRMSEPTPAPPPKEITMCINSNYECDFTAKQVKSCAYAMPDYPEDGEHCTIFDEYGTQFDGKMEAFPVGWYCCPDLGTCTQDQISDCKGNKYCCSSHHGYYTCTNNGTEQVINYCSHL